MNEKNRTATELLVSIEEKLDSIVKSNTNIQFNYSLILQKLKSIQDNVAFLLEDKNKKSTSAAIPQSFNQVKTVNSIKNTPAPLPKKEEEFIFADADTQTSKVIVRQKITYPASDGMKEENATLVNIHIYKIQNGEKVLFNSKIKTATNGYWTTKLEPGNYAVHATKNPSGKKPKIDNYKEFQVLPSNEHLELTYP